MNYELTSETKLAPNGETLYRIQAINDIPSKRIKKGDLGGWIGKNATLEDCAWISDEAIVYDKSKVSHNAHVFGNAQISGTAHIIHDSNIFGNARVFGDAWVGGSAHLFGNARLGDQVVVSSQSSKLVMDVSNKFSVTFTKTFAYLHISFYIRNVMKPQLNKRLNK